jgi:hypothetical protein
MLACRDDIVNPGMVDGKCTDGITPKRELGDENRDPPHRAYPVGGITSLSVG